MVSRKLPQSRHPGSQPILIANSVLKNIAGSVRSPLECVAGVSGGKLKKGIKEVVNHSIVRKPSGGKKLMLVATRVTAFTVPLGGGDECARAACAVKHHETCDANSRQPAPGRAL